MYKISGVVHKYPSSKRIQQLQTLKAGFINNSLSFVAPEVINGLEETVKEENA